MDFLGVTPDVHPDQEGHPPMADDAALRARRSRRHRAGDHSMCIAGRCEALGGASRGTPPAIVTIPAGPLTVAPSAPSRELGDDGDQAPGRIEQLARAFVASLPYGPTDPRHLIAEMAVELARRVDQTGAAPAAIRELRVMLNQLAEAPNGPAGVVDEQRLRYHQRQLDALLATAAA